MKQLTFLFLLICNVIIAQESLLQSGPMLGFSGFREVLIWVQTNKDAEVKVAYFSHLDTVVFSEPYMATKENDHIVKISANNVRYGTTYQYELYINDILIDLPYNLSFQTQELWQWRKSPPEFTFAIGSCVYVNEPKDDRPGKGYGGDYGIFDEILFKDPDFMLWLGDNTYLREPDFLSEEGIRYRFRKSRSLRDLQPLLGSVHHYAIWDDHDYGPNDADKSYVNKKLTESAFNDYWANPNTNVVDNGGITGQFMWQDVAFFLLDNRYHRDPNRSHKKNKNLLGQEQLDWLINALVSSRAPFKFICIGGQSISDAPIYENYASYPEERAQLLKRIHEEKIEGVIFLSGDRHHTEISKMERKEAYPLHDFTCSPLTSGTHHPKDEKNSFILKEKTFYDRNFGLINVSGSRTNRVLKLSIFNNKGEFQWDYTVKAKDLRYPRD